MRSALNRLFDFYWGNGIADDVPALTYYLVLSLAPFALGIAALEALLLRDVLSAYEVASQLNRFLPDAVHEDIRKLVIGTRDNSPLLLALALVAMLWTTSGAIGVIERCESRMLDCPRHSIVAGRIRNLGLGALVGLTFVFAAAGAPVIGDVVRNVPGSGTVITALGSIAVFAVIFRFAPRSRLHWRTALFGAVPAGVAVQAIPTVVGLYFEAGAGFAAVRIFLLIAVLLLGLWVMANALLIGAGIAVEGENRVRDREARVVRPQPVVTEPGLERVPV